MGFLDRFRDAPAPATTPRGRTGRGHFGGFLQLEELNAELAGTRGLQVYDRMWRTDPDVRRVVSMCINPLLAATATIVPYGEDEAAAADQEAAELVRWALFEAMRPGLGGHLAEALPVLVRSGFAPFEQIWHAVDWQGRTVQVPRKLGLRLPRTITRFDQDELGDLTRIWQQLPLGGEVGLPAHDLIYYRVGAEGDNWDGTSLLRPAYKPWFFKDRIERLDAIAQERESTGIPVVYPPSSEVDDAVLDDLEEKLANIRAGEQSYLVMPGPRAQDIKDAAGAGWLFELVGFGGAQGGRDAQPSLEYHRDGIAAAFVAEFMRLGQAGEGARATADVQQDPFLAGVEALSAVIEGPVNEELIPRICALNLDVDEPPKLQLSLVDSTSLTELKEFVAGLVEKGVLQPDQPLEDFLRKRADLPSADPQERKRRDQERDAGAKAAAAAAADAAGEGEGDPDDKPDEQDEDTTALVALSVATDRGEMRWWEQHMSLQDISSSIDGARDTFQRAARDETHQLARTLAGQLQAEKATRVDTGPLAAILEEQLGALYETGRRTVGEELARQGAAQAGLMLDRQVPAGALRRRARLAADGIVSRIVQRVSRLVLGGRHTEAEVLVAGEQEATAALRAEAIAHAAPALNLGRGHEAQARAGDIAGTYYTSILDTRRCGTCRAADDDILRRLDDPVRLSRVPPNPLCEGGGACRCMEAFVLADEAPMDLRALDRDGWRDQPRDPGGEDGGQWVTVGGGAASSPKDVFNVVAYHGTGKDIANFDKPAYFSPDSPTAARYATPDGYVYKVELAPSSIADHEDVRRVAAEIGVDASDFFDALYTQDLRNALVAAGYQAVRADEGGEVNILTLPGAAIRTIGRVPTPGEDDLYNDWEYPA